ncbi:MAG: hypothetical protein IJT49_08165 [Clostridia bacterium]|nr:hypothetical protein [Clostridia bacterium]
MKKDFYKILDNCSEQELEILLQGVKVSSGSSAEKRIKNKVFSKLGISGKAKKNTLPRRIIAVSAATVAVLSLSVGIYAAYTEAAEYTEAVEYFEENGFSVAGMTRSEIKTLYREIKSRLVITKEDGKTDHIYAKDVVTGTELDGYDRVVENTEKDVINCFIKVDWRDFYSSFERVGSSHFYVTHNGSMVFDYEARGVYLFNYCAVSDGYILVGDHIDLTPDNDISCCGCIIKLDLQGKQLWQMYLDKNGDHQLPYEFTINVAVKENSDKTVAVLGQGFKALTDSDGNIVYYGDRLIKYDFGTIWFFLYEISADGNIINTKEHPSNDSYEIKSFLKMGDGYLLKLNETFVSLTSELEVVNAVNYSEAGYQYVINDICEYDGKIYISADRLALSPNGVDYTHSATKIGAYLLGHLFKGIEKDQLPLYALNLKDEDVTDTVLNSVSAVLFVCDGDMSAPAAFYTVTGAFTKNLSVNDGKLVWETNNIESCSGKHEGYFRDSEKARNSFRISVICECTEYNYTFKGDDSPVEKLKTDTQNKLKF